MKSAKEGSAKEEMGESPEEEASEGVTVPEEFQQATHELLSKAKDKHHLNHVRDRVYQKEDEMRKEETKGSKGKGPKGDMMVDPSIEG